LGWVELGSVLKITTHAKNNDTTTLLIIGHKESFYQNSAGPTIRFEEGEDGSDEEQLQDSICAQKERMPSPKLLLL
jgi:hypothetical protein